MEATQANMPSGCVNNAVSIDRCNQLPETSAFVHPTTAPRYESYRGVIGAYPETKWRSSPSNNRFKETVKLPDSGYHPQMQAPASPKGVSNCYVFKSRLQEYAQKVELPTPTYETIKEGPSHAPSFRSTVIVGGARYDSLLGFHNRKAAEQSAAEVALMELSASGNKKESISVPVHETGLCKNVLQEYAQKMNYAIPTYTCKKEGATGRSNLFSCTVDIGGIQYIGTAATSKKEAEIKAARTALLAIHSSRSVEGESGGKTNYTVVPLKRKVPENPPPQEETSKPKKSKRPRYKNKRPKKTQPGFSDNQIQAGNMVVCVNSMGFPNGDQNVQVAGDGQSRHCLESSAQVNGATNVVAHIGKQSDGEGEGGFDVQVSTNAGQLTVGVKNNMDTPTVDQNVQMADDGQTGHCMETSAQVIETTNMMVDPMVHIGEPSEGEGRCGSDVQLSANASQSTIYVKKNMGTPTGEQNIEMADDGQSGHCMESSAQVNGDTTVMIGPIVHIGEPSEGEGDGGSDGTVNANARQLSISQQEGDTGLKDAIRLDSGTKLGDSGDGPTAAKAVLPGVGPVDHVVAAASPLMEETKTGTSETKVNEISSVYAVISCSDQAVNDANASPLSEGRNTGTSETKVNEISAVDAVISCSDQTVNDANASPLKEERNTGTSSAVDAVISCSDQTVTVNDADSNA